MLENWSTRFSGIDNGEGFSIEFSAMRSSGNTMGKGVAHIQGSGYRGTNEVTIGAVVEMVCAKHFVTSLCERTQRSRWDLLPDHLHKLISIPINALVSRLTLCEMETGHLYCQDRWSNEYSFQTGAGGSWVFLSIFEINTQDNRRIHNYLIYLQCHCIQVAYTNSTRMRHMSTINIDEKY